MSTAPHRPNAPDVASAWPSVSCCGPDTATARVLAELDAGSWDRVTVTVLGPRGSGRTRILRDLQDAAQRRGLTVLSAAAGGGSSGRALSVFQQLFGRATSPGAGVAGEIRAVFEDAFSLTPSMALPAVDLRRLVELTGARLRELASASRTIILLDDAASADDDLDEYISGVHGDLPARVSVVRVGGSAARQGLLHETVVGVTPWCPVHSDRALDRLPRPPAGPVRLRLLAQAAGNPLALAELGRQAAGHPEWGEPGLPMLPLPPHLVDVFAPGLPDLPLATREGLALAAAARGDLRIMGTAMDDVKADAHWSVAQENGWVHVRGRRLHFRHPMVRAAAYHAVSPSRMRLLHRRIAAAVESDPARSAWHRAVGGAEPDESLAAELERTSVRLTSLGASRAAIEALSTAASVTPGAADRDRRLRMAARLARAVDQPEWADRLDVAPPSGPPAADTHTPAHRAALVDVLAAATDDLYRTGRLSQPDAVAQLVIHSPATTTGRTAADAVDATLRLWAAALLDFATHRRAAAAVINDPALTTALLRVAKLTATPRTALDRAVGKAALLLDETGVAVERLLAAATPAHQAAVEGDAAEALVWALVDAGRMTEAAAWATRIVRSRRSSPPDRSSVGAQVALAVVDGWISRAPDDGFERASTLFDPTESPHLAVWLQRAKGAAAASAGRHGDAWRSLRAIWHEDGRPHHGVVSDLAIGDAAAAAAHTHRDDDASRLLGLVESRQGEAASLRQRLLLHRARALLADDDHAEHHFRLALVPGAARWPHERAMARLDYAEWLRRRQRPADARPELEAARDAFIAAAMPAWAERAARELATARALRTGSPMPGTLTPQQRRIANLAAQGLSNRQIADQLFLSLRTVTTHMTYVFRSLDVKRRMHLADVLADVDRNAASPSGGPARRYGDDA